MRIFEFYWMLKNTSLAERVGFEPTIRYNRIPDFESGAFDHSATFPRETTILTELWLT